MKSIEIRAGERTVRLFAEGSEPRPLIYIHIYPDELEILCKMLKKPAFALAAITDSDWDGDLSPWPAPAAFRGGEDFSGRADAQLKRLQDDIIPAVESTLDFTPTWRGIAGYSLAGLFAVYALYKSELFTHAASMSGSLWYDGFMDFAKANKPETVPEKLYFSLGSKESSTRNLRMAAVGDCTARTEALFADMGVKTVYETNPGGHFADIPARIKKGLEWLADK